MGFVHCQSVGGMEVQSGLVRHGRGDGLKALEKCVVGPVELLNSGSPNVLFGDSLGESSHLYIAKQGLVCVTESGW